MPAMFTTNKRLLQANIRALLLRSVESWVGIQNIMGYVWIADRIAWSRLSVSEDDRKSERATKNFGFRMIAQSQLIADDRRTWFYLLGSSTTTTAEVCFHMHDRRRSQNFVRSAIRDPRSSAIIWKPAFMTVAAGIGPEHNLWRAFVKWSYR